MPMTYGKDLFPRLESRYDKPLFGGPDIDAKMDIPRLKGQLEKVRRFMADGHWRSLQAIASEVGCTTQSASARLRDLRKPKFGGLTVLRKRINPSGVFLYRIDIREDEGRSQS